MGEMGGTVERAFIVTLFERNRPLISCAVLSC